MAGVGEHVKSRQRGRWRDAGAWRGGRGLGVGREVVASVAGVIAALGMGCDVARAETVALWLFDEPVGVVRAGGFGDAGPANLALTAGARGQLVPGKFGGALRVRPAEAGNGPAKGAIGGPSHATPACARLNLGAGDWTLECWLWLDDGAEAEAGEGVIYEFGRGGEGAGSGGDNAILRLSVWPRENAFEVAGISRGSEGVVPAGPSVQLANPGGPPATMHVWRVAAMLAVGPDVSLPRGRWFHVAVVHTAADGNLRLFLDGKRCGAATANLCAAPEDGGMRVVVGCDGNGERPLRGAVDELRISDAAVYRADFGLPASWAPSAREAGAEVKR